MYCIYQLNDKNEESIIKIVQSKEEFFMEIEKKNYEMIKDLTVEQFKLDNKFRLGFYLLNNGNQIQLIKKYDSIAKGYLYNTTEIDTKILFTWRFIPLDLNEDLVFKEFNSNIETGQSDTSSLIINGIDKYQLIEKLIDDQLSTNKNFDILIVTNRNCNIFYEIVYSSLPITYGCDDNIIQNYLKMRKLKIEDKIFNSKGIVVIDDCDFVNSSKVVADLVQNHKYYGITLIMSVYPAYNLSPILKSSFDYVFLLHPYLIEDKIKLYEKYCATFSTFNEFITHFIPTKMKYMGFVINNLMKCENKLDKIFYLKHYNDKYENGDD